MTPRRQNVTDIFRRKTIVNAVPDFELCPAMIEKFERKFGHRDFATEFGFPIRGTHYSLLRQHFTEWKDRYYPNTKFLPETSFDIWGVAHESTPESMHMSRMYHPMKEFTSREEFESYPYPEFDPAQIPTLQKTFQSLHEKDFFIAQNMQCTVWEAAWYMRSMEEMMVGMLSDDDNTRYHLDRITDLACRRAAAYTAAGADLVFLGDDIGMQHTIMMSKELYCDWLKPRLTRVIQAARKENPDVLIGYHSCGYVEPFIDDLIEAGVDVLNPVQPECMKFTEIHEKYGDRLSFWGTLGTQTLFPHGTPEEVYRETIRNLQTAGPHGGLLATPTHLVEPEVPLENIIAYVQACKEFAGTR